MTKKYISRVFYIKAQHSLNKSSGEQTLLKILLITGTMLTFTFGFGLVIFDDKKSADKVCLHYSNEDLEIINQYLVSLSHSIKLSKLQLRQ